MTNLSKFKDLPHPEGNTDTPYLWQFKGPNPGPTVTLLGGVHGNEPSGIDIVHSLQIEAIQEELIAGTLNLGIGNPDACEADVRFLDDDLNRVMEQVGLSQEKKRAATLRPILQASDVMIDVHNSDQDADIFLIAHGTQHQLSDCIPELGIPLIVTGHGLTNPSGEAEDTDAYTAKYGGLGITIEAGWKDQPQTEIVKLGIKMALYKLGMLKNKPQAVSPIESMQHLEAYQYLLAGPAFKFTKTWKNFEFIPAGQIYAYEGDTPLITPCDTFIMFPKRPERIKPGKQVCILLKSAMPQPDLATNSPQSTILPPLHHQSLQSQDLTISSV